MSTPENQLAPGEEQIFLTRQHPLVFILPVLFNIIALILIIGLAAYSKRPWLLIFYIVPLIGFSVEFLSWRKRLYILTDKRVIKQEGILTVTVVDLPLDSIHRIFCTQGISGRIFRFGSVGIESVDESGVTLFHSLAKPEGFKNRISLQQKLFRDRSEAEQLLRKCGESKIHN